MLIFLNLCIIDAKATEQALTQVLKNSPNVSEICCSSISVKGLRIIASHCGPSLQTIKAEVGSDSLKAIQSICQACPNLKALNLRSCGASENGDALMLTAAQHCRSIEQVSTKRLNLTDMGMNALATVHTLREFTLYCTNCTSAAIQLVLQSNPLLTDINLESNCIDDALVNCIGRYCSNLKRLELELVYAVSPAIPNVILIDLFKGCPLLTVFKLHKPGVVVPNTALGAMFEYCHHITELDLSKQCAFVSSLLGAMLSQSEEADLDVEPILYTHNSSLTKLTVISNAISNNALRDMLIHCINLREVNLYCAQFNNDIVNILTMNCARLKSLSLAECWGITTAVMLQIVTHCTSLTTLFLSNVPLNDEALIQLSLHCPCLTKLQIFDCDSFTEAGILAVLEICTGLAFLDIRGEIAITLLPYLDLPNLERLYPHIKFCVIR